MGTKLEHKNGSSAAQVMNHKMKLYFSTDVNKVYSIYSPKCIYKIIQSSKAFCSCRYKEVKNPIGFFSNSFGFPSSRILPSPITRTLGGNKYEDFISSERSLGSSSFCGSVCDICEFFTQSSSSLRAVLGQSQKLHTQS